MLAAGLCLTPLGSAAHALEEPECLSCHDTWSTDRLATFTSSVHGGLDCATCHTGHESYPHDPAAGGPYESCATCHDEQSRGFGRSVHAGPGRAASKPFERQCAACHGGPHELRAAGAALPEASCMRCHGDQAASMRLGLSPDVIQTYQDSMHGQKRSLGHERSPGCVDCHGSHGVLSAANPASTMHVANRAKQCASCHEGATELFALNFSHDPPDMEHRPVARVVSAVYAVLIVLTLAFFGGMIVLELTSLILRKLLGRPLLFPHIDTSMRFTVAQRLQHVAIVVSFLLLVLTGLPLIGGPADLEAGLLGLFGGIEGAGKIHRIAGSVMLLATIWHVLWLGLQHRRGRLEVTMLPSFVDLVELRDQVAAFLLLRDRLPARSGKYGWIEKVEYWAFAWGVGIMGLTGGLLWFPVIAAAWLPGGALPVVQLIHGYEAILATASVFLWHFYQVHLKPGIFPMSWTWLTGREK